MSRTTPAPKGGSTVSEAGHLKEPLGLALAPNGNIVTTNAGDGNMVETTPAGKQLAVQIADKKTGADRCSVSRSQQTASASTSWTTAKTH